jgi:hypothetical protein
LRAVAQHTAGTTVRNDTPDAIRVPLGGVGDRSRLLWPGATTTLSEDDLHNSQVAALIRVRSLQVLNAPKPARIHRELLRVDPAWTEAQAEALEDTEAYEDEVPDVHVPKDNAAEIEKEEQPMPHIEAEHMPASNGAAAPLKVPPKPRRKRKLSGGARRMLAKRAALAATAEAATVWANGANGNANGHHELEIAVGATEPGVDTLAAVRLALAGRALAVAERVLAIAEAA